MRNFQQFQRQLLSLICRAVVDSVKPGSKCQTVDVELLAGEQKGGIEHLEAYGFTSHAKPGAEALILFPAADRSHAVAVAVSDRRYRIRSLKPGEVAIYDDLGQSVTLTRSGIVVDGGGSTITFRNAPKARFEMDIESTGQIKDHCDTTGVTMAEMRLTYNGHKHEENGNKTDAPDNQMGA